MIVSATTGMVMTMTWLVMFQGSHFFLNEDEPDDDRVNDEEDDFHYALTSCDLFRFQFRDARAQSFHFSLLPSSTSSFEVADRFVHIGAVSHLVQDRLGVGPEPRNWPEQPTKEKREQTEAMNRVRLRMLFLFGNLFRHDMQQPENGDADNRRDHEHDPRDAIGD